MMPKKSSKSGDKSGEKLRERLLKLKADAEGGDLPWMAKCVLDQWIEMEVDARSIQEHHDAGPKEEWSCYRADAHVEGRPHIEYIEVPFWAMAGLMDAVLATVKDSGWSKFEFKRSRDGKNNEAEFQWD